MMDDVSPTAVTALDRSTSGGRQGGDSPRRYLAASAPSKRTVDDVAAVLGGTDGVLSQAVEHSIAALVQEVERLRREVDLAHHYENFLGEEADRHPILPVLNRRALLRALGQLLVASEQAGVPGSLLYVHVGGVERLRVRYGLAASDLALAQIAQTIRAECRQTDLVGYLDGGDFAIALALAEPAAADEKARALADRLVEQPLIWGDSRHFFTVGFGLARFRAELSAEEALNLADGARRGVSPPDDPVPNETERFVSP
jgi:GGDEF domain-containing protein